MGVHFRQWLLALGILASLGPAPALAQTGSVTGRVTDRETGEPLASVRVEVVTPAGRAVADGFTGADGRYSLADVPTGGYALLFSLVGYETYRIDDVRVRAGAGTTANAVLTSVAFRLNPVIVSASKRQEKVLEAPASVAVVDEQAIDARPTVTPADHLRSTPGVDIITTGLQSTNVVVRGFNNIFSGALHFLTDNRIAGIPSLRVNLLHYIPSNDEDVERMEVVLGPGSALYGPNTANGVLHVITKSPLDYQGTSVTVAGGNQSMMQAAFRTSHLLSPTFGLKVSGQFVRGEEWFYVDSTELAAKRLAEENFQAWAATQPAGIPPEELAERAARLAARDFDIERWGVEARADWQAGENLRTSFTAGWTSVGSAIEQTGIGAAQAKDWTYGFYQVRANAGRFFAQAYLNTSDAGDTYLLRTGAPIVDRSKVAVAQIQHGFEMGEKQTFTYGADYISTMPETEGTINGSREDDDNYTEVGAYLQSETRLSPKLDLVLAGRLDKHSEIEDPFFSPRAGIVFKPTPEHNFRATYNRAFSNPTSLNLYLDIDGGPAGTLLGPLGYRIRAQGPGTDGFSFHKSDGSLAGMRSPFGAALGATPSTLLDITAGNLYDLQLAALAAVSAAQGRPLNPQLIQYMQSLKGGAEGIPVLGLDPVTQNLGALDPAAIEDVPGIEESITSTYEVGYKGMLGKRVLLAADLWFSEHKNMTTPLIPHGQFAMLHPQQLGGYLVPRLTQFFMQAGMPQAQAQATATAIATGMASIPGGVVSSPDVNADAGAALLVTYRNFGHVDLWGADLSAKALLTDRWSLGVTASFVSDDFFRLGTLGGIEQTVALNSPKTKGSLSLGYRNSELGFDGEARVRYTDGFPANSADYVGLNCVLPADEQTPGGACVDAYTLVDLTMAYTLPLPGLSLQLAVQNVLDEAYRSFVGVPEIRRTALLRLKYDF